MAYKLVIIDDNPTTVKSLSECFDWAALDVQVGGVAYDGIAGMELIRKVKPDLIITDINMPDVDGLSMIEQLFDELQSTKTIIITGYDEFQYASRAIKLSVFDFILKPIDDAELERAVRLAIDSLVKERSKSSELQQMHEYVRRAQLVSMLTAAESYSTCNFSAPDDLSFELDTYCIITAQCPGGVSQPLLRRIDSEQSAESLSVVSIVIEDVLVFLFMLEDEDGWKQSVQDLAQRLFHHEPDFFIAVSDLHHSREYIREAYMEAKWLLLDSRLMEQLGNIRFYGNLVNKRLSCTTLLPDESIEKIRNYCEREMVFQDIFEKLYAVSCGEIEKLRISLMFFCRHFIRSKTIRKQWPEILDKVIFNVSEIGNKDEARVYLARFFMFIDDMKKDVESFSMLVNKVLCYISMHSIEGVKLVDVAGVFNVSPNYLSSLISKETGITYQQHIINAKMRVAKQMLGDTRMGIEEIAHAIGYENYVSFYSVFKRIEGKTPTEYRINCSSTESGCYESYYTTIVPS